MIKKLTILLLSFLLFGTEWDTYNGYQISHKDIVIMIDENLAPKLGKEEPIKLHKFIELSSILKNYDDASMSPLFTFYKTFTDKHYKYHLHQYYLITFASYVDIVKLVGELGLLRELLI